MKFKSMRFLGICLGVLIFSGTNAQTRFDKGAGLYGTLLDDLKQNLYENARIRTVTLDTSEGTAEYGVGGGITWDSLSDAEYAEAKVKAQLLVERRPEFALIETLRWEPAYGYRWRGEHVERLGDSADFFAFPFDQGEIEAALDEAVEGAASDQRVRLLLRRDGSV